MKVEIKDKEKESKPFPKLMIRLDGLIILMKSEREGTVINKIKNKKSVGYYSENWVYSELKDFDGEITLSND